MAEEETKKKEAPPKPKAKAAAKKPMFKKKVSTLESINKITAKAKKIEK